MKKVILLSVLLLLACSLCACAAGETGEVTYTVTVLGTDGHAAAGVSVQLCKDEACLLPKKTDANGKMTFALAAGEDITAYHLVLSALPEGQSAAEEYRFTPGSKTLEIRLTQ